MALALWLLAAALLAADEPRLAGVRLSQLPYYQPPDEQIDELLAIIRPAIRPAQKDRWAVRAALLARASLANPSEGRWPDTVQFALHPDWRQRVDQWRLDALGRPATAVEIVAESIPCFGRPIDDAWRVHDLRKRATLPRKTLRHRVVDNNGDPLAGVSVFERSAPAFALTGKDGLAELEVADEGYNLSGCVWKTGYGLHGENLKFQDADPKKVREWRLAPAPDLAFRVVGADGRPIANAGLHLWTDRRHPNGSLAARVFGCTQTDDLGNAAFPALPLEIDYGRLEAEHSEFVAGGAPVTPAPDLANRTITLSRGATVQGLALRHDGRPAAHAAISYRAAGDAPGGCGDYYAGRADLDGRYRLRGVKPGKWLLAASTADDPLTLLPLVIASADQTLDIDIHLEKGRFVAGIVVDSQDRPLAGAEVSYRRLVAEPQHFLQPTYDPRATVSDSAGRFRVGPFAGDGERTFHVFSADGMGGTKFTAAPGAAGATVRIEARK